MSDQAAGGVLSVVIVLALLAYFWLVSPTRERIKIQRNLWKRRCEAALEKYDDLFVHYLDERDRREYWQHRCLRAEAASAHYEETKSNEGEK